MIDISSQMVQPGWRVRQPLGIASSSASVRAIVDAFFIFLEVLPDTNRLVPRWEMTEVACLVI